MGLFHRLIHGKEDHGAQAAMEHNLVRSKHWPSIEKAFKRSHPYCLACGRTDGIQVHHARIPFHFAILLGRPDLELDFANLCSLCENERGIVTDDHHFVLGHGGNFQMYIPSVMEISTGVYYGKKRAEIEADPAYQVLVASMPKVWAEWTDDDKAFEVKRLADLFPPPYVNVDDPLHTQRGALA